MSSSSINSFFKDQTVFVTGGTGFLGKVLVEKLLRLDQIKKIYLLLRPKKGSSTEQRFKDLFAYPCFDRLKRENAHFKNKIEFLSGDCEEPNLGLDTESIELLIKETSIVIHAAANVKFDQPLRVAANINVRSTRDAVQLAKRMSKLKAFVYVSTAYSNCPHSDINEEFYNPPMTSKQLLSIVDNIIDDEILNKITPQLIGKWPNCYTFTKTISEDLIKSEGKDLPIAVVRPSIVSSTIEEPMPGWNDNFYGINGIAAAGILGVLRSLYIKKNATGYVVPCDYVINFILAAAWKISNEKSNKAAVYNYVGSTTNKITWQKFYESINNCGWDYFTEKVIWYPSGGITDNRLWHNICVFFLHTCVAYLVDFILICIGREAIAVKNYRRLDNILDLTSYFATNVWNFRQDNVEGLWQELNDDDKKLYKFDMGTVDWDCYIRNSVVGGRIYLLKDPLDTIPQGLKKMKILRIAHYTFIAIFFSLVWLLFKCIFAYIL